MVCFAFATPAAIVPTPAFDTNFTEILACLFAFFDRKQSGNLRWNKYRGCGGGEIKPTPGVGDGFFLTKHQLYRYGNCPPSPGFAPAPF